MDRVAKKNEREIALDVLTDIFYGGAYNNLALNKALEGAAETARPAITEMVNGVLRNYIFLDYTLSQFTKISKTKPVVLCLLRLSAYQIIFMKTPDYAVCNEAVAIAKKRGLGGLSGFVNGTLRNVARGHDDVKLPTSEIQFLSVKHSCPEWIVRRFLTQFGRKKTEQSLEVNSTAPNVTIRVNTLKTSIAALRAMLEAEGATVENGRFDSDCLHISKVAIAGLQAFKDGLFHVQDESAALPVIMANPQPGNTIIDLCAAPGGKSFTAAYLTQDLAQITAYDIFEHKIGLIEQGIARLGLNSIKTAISDATVFKPELEGSADIVLLDAPCSGLGLLRKKPDIRLTKTEEHIAELAQLQQKMATVAWRYAKPGGTLVYSTCTLTRDENEDMAEWMAKNLPLKLVEMRTVLPSDFGTDGFFAAKFVI